MLKLFSLFVMLCVVCSSTSVMANPKASKNQQQQQTKKKAVEPEDTMTIEERREFIKKLRAETEKLQDWLRAHNRFETLTDVNFDSFEDQTSLEMAQKTEKESIKKAKEDKNKREEKLEKEFDEY